MKLEKSLNNQDLMFQSRNVEASKSSSGSYRYLTTYDRQKNDGKRKTRYEVQELLAAEYETDGSMKFITGKICELYRGQKSKERYVPRNG